MPSTFIGSATIVTATAVVGKKRWCYARASTDGMSKEGATMGWEEREDRTIYKVVVNHEEQYSIWPANRENALGWNDAGKTGTKEECLEYIKEVWTDMRPLSLRKKMEEMARGEDT
jgi:MbtH protein